MGIFDNEDEFNEEFMNRWEKFNERMKNDVEFREETEKAKRDFQELMKMLTSQRGFGSPMDFRIIPLNNKDFDPRNFNIQSGEDENGKWETKDWTSPDGSFSYSSFKRSSEYGDENGLPDGIAEEWASKLRNRDTKRMDPEKAKKIKLTKLQRALEQMVAEEKYEESAEIKKLMDEIKSENKKEENI